MLVGLGVAGAGAGVGLGLGSRAAANRASPNCVDQGDGGLCLGSTRKDLDANKSLALGADIAFVAGAVLAATGVVVIATSPRSTLAVGGSSVTFSGRF